MNKTRIVKCDDRNLAVEVLVEVELTEEYTKEDGKVGRRKTGKTEMKWQEKGYYGSNWEWAAKSAIFEAMPVGEPITPQMIKDACALIVEGTKEYLSASAERRTA